MTLTLPSKTTSPRISSKRTYSLQDLVFPKPGALSSLFVQSDDHAGCELLADRSDAVIIPPGRRLSFDSYINSFYERYWLEFSAVDSVALELEIEGDLVIEVRRHATAFERSDARAKPRRFRSQIVANERLGYNAKRTIHLIDLPPANPTLTRYKTFHGRLWLDVYGAGKLGGKLLSGRWVTRTPPIRNPTIGITICTFDKPGEVIRNLKAIQDLVGHEGAFCKILVVDQGQHKVADQSGWMELVASSEFAGRLSIAEQPNYGGAGGFTRGILETFRDSTISHVLLMDDDVVIEPSSLAKLASFLRFTKEPMIVGGSMFDLLHPNVQHAHTEECDYQTLTYEAVTPHGLDMSKKGVPDIFIDVTAGTYNGWWLCCIPREAVAQCGLPMPCFVRCDDAEFGTRLTSSGFPLVALPGVFIWHEPFHAKSVAWMIYYEIRNFLILASLRDARPTWRQQASLLKRFYSYLSANMRDHALAYILAVEDFCKGPQHVFAHDTQVRHDAMQAAISPLKTPTDNAPFRKIAYPSPRLNFLPPLLRGIGSLAWVFVFANKTREAARREYAADSRHVAGQYMVGRSALVVQHRYLGSSLVYKPDPAMSRALTTRFIKAIWSWWRNRTELAKRFREEMPQVTSHENWCSYLKLDPANYSACGVATTLSVQAGKSKSRAPDNLFKEWVGSQVSPSK